MNEEKLAREFLRGRIVLIVEKDKDGIVQSSLIDATQLTNKWDEYQVVMLASSGSWIEALGERGSYNVIHLCNHIRGDFENFKQAQKLGVDILATDTRLELFDE